MEDIEAGLWKHDEGNDIGRRKTLFWETLVQLPENIISTDEIDFVKQTYKDLRLYYDSNGSQKTADSENAIKQLLEIGRKYRKQVIYRLIPVIDEKIHLPAVLILDGIPLLNRDETNVQYKNILRNGLEKEWQKFLSWN